METKLFKMLLISDFESHIESFKIEDLHFYKYGNILLMQYRPSSFINDLSKQKLQSLIKIKKAKFWKIDTHYFTDLLNAFLNQTKINYLSIKSVDEIYENILNKELSDILSGYSELPMQNINESFSITELYARGDRFELTINKLGVITFISDTMLPINLILNMLAEVAHE